MKYSYLFHREVLSIALKDLNIPQFIHSEQALINEEDELLYRVRVDCGEHFYCYSSLQSIRTLQSLKESIDVDLVGHRFAKLSIVCVKGRPHSGKAVLNELCNEKVICSTTLSIEDFTQGNGNHTIHFSQNLFSLNSVIDPSKEVTLGCDISVKTVNGGAYDTMEMQGA